MPVVTCPKCSARLKVAADLPADARVKCPRCQTSGPVTPTDAEEVIPLELDDDPTQPHARAIENEGPPSARARIAPFAFVAFVYLVGVLTGWLATRTPGTPTSQTVAASPTPQPSEPKIEPSAANRDRERERPRPTVDPTDATEPKKPKPPVDRPPPAQETVTAAALMKNFLSSNSGSNAAYRGKWLEVSGTVADLRFDVGDVVIVQLDGGNPWRKVVRCTMRPSQAEAAKKLLNGHSVVIRGRCDGHTSPQSGVAGDTTVDVLLGDCYVIKAE